MANRRKNESDTLSINSKESRKESLKNLQENYNLEKREAEKFKKWEEDLDREVVTKKYILMREAEEAAHKKRLEDYEKEGKHLKVWWEKSFGSSTALANTAKTLTGIIDESLNKYIDAQQKMSAHLQGSNTSLTSVLNNLQSTLTTSGLIRQEKVFDNLGSLIKSGITYNVEQRAFLQTISEDISAVFDATNGSLTRLIRIQQQDLSANRLAIEYSLQKFLNQNYQTSEYIKTAFEGVSSSLLSAQVALQNSTEAIKLESAVQTQLGSMFSGGISQQTVQGLADAINALGTGDVSNIGSGMSNLLIMAAARAGMDYGQLLNQGVTGQQASVLLNSVTSYLAEMNTAGSNVVKSQLGKLFGVDISDIIAAGNIGQIQGSVGSNINDLFNDYGNFMSFGTQLQNTISNLKWSFGTNMAKSPGQLMSYEISKIIAQSGLGDILQSVGDTFQDATSSIPFFGAAGGAVGAALRLAGIAANAAPLFPIITSFLGSDGMFMDVLNSLGSSGQGMQGLFSALGNNTMALDNVAIKMSQAGTSGSMYIGTGSTSDLLSGSMSSLNDLTSNAVTVSNEEDKITLEDNVTTMTSDLASILEILETYMDNISDNLDIIATSTSLSTGGYLGAAAGLIYNHVL